MVSHHTAMIYTMVLVSAADGALTDAELAVIGDIIRTLPVFADYDTDRLTQTAADCAEMLGADDGFETVLAMIAQGRCPNVCARPPTCSPATWRRPIWRPTRKNSACSKCCAISSRSSAW